REDAGGDSTACEGAPRAGSDRRPRAHRGMVQEVRHDAAGAASGARCSARGADRRGSDRVVRRNGQISRRSTKTRKDENTKKKRCSSIGTDIGRVRLQPHLTETSISTTYSAPSPVNRGKSDPGEIRHAYRR